ncbi:MAG: sulfide/dihydroorotate dehydrogenase-like FAD/NAD-binding protein [Candidatus Omnitrophica bacterium]|nr:sulfide/dihydroorotate dehydrogenase-like FAD/NAD-binding protein [Candidatus Omnitrophota bacterium]
MSDLSKAGKIIAKEIIADYAGVRIVKLTVSAPEISRKAKAGQFVVVMASEKGERIPLTIVEADSKAQTITLIFQEAGLTTKILSMLNAGDDLYALAGPLGHASEIKNYGKVILVGGGVGIAEIYPVATSLKQAGLPAGQAGNNITVVIGAKTKELLILEKELRDTADKIYLMTDDGSLGQKGFTTDVLEELLKKDKYDLVYAVGPIPMMKKVSQISQSFNIKTIVSLNALMVDATGMCGCCRVTVAGKVKFSCVDGPEFEAGQVDWEELEKRNLMYLDKEKHLCKLKG